MNLHELSRCINHNYRSSLPEVFLWKANPKYIATYKKTPTSKEGFNKVAKQLYWNHTSQGFPQVLQTWGGGSFLSEGGAPWGASVLVGGVEQIVRWGVHPPMPLPSPLWETLHQHRNPPVNSNPIDWWHKVSYLHILHISMNSLMSVPVMAAI